MPFVKSPTMTPRKMAANVLTRGSPPGPGQWWVGAVLC